MILLSVQNAQHWAHTGMPDSSGLHNSLIKRQQYPSSEVISSFPFELTEKYLPRVAKILQEGITWGGERERERKERNFLMYWRSSTSLLTFHRNKFDSNRNPRDRLLAQLQVKAHCRGAWECCFLGCYPENTLVYSIPGILLLPQVNSPGTPASSVPS